MSDSFRNSRLFILFSEAMARRDGITRLVVALSGGLDSMMLVRFAAAWREVLGAGIPILAAHVNHGLRGKEADADALFCRELSDNLGIAYSELAADAAATGRAEGIGLEEAGRRIRYRFFRELAGEDGVVLVGHHADDQVETILLNLRRGAHARGLSGMRESGAVTVPRKVSVNVLRPFLGIRKQDLSGLAREQGWNWREDVTNADSSFSRNRVRNRIVPALERLAPGFSERLLERARAMREVDERQSARAAEYLEVWSGRESGGLFMALTPGILADLELLGYVLRRLVEGETGKRVSGGRALFLLSALAVGGGLNEAVSLTGGLYARRERDGLYFFRGVEESVGDCLELPRPPFSLSGYGMWITADIIDDDRSIPESDIVDDSVEWLNMGVIRFPLCLRRGFPGERFRVIGSLGSRRIQDLLVDMKVPRRHRGVLRVLADVEGVLWVWPLRLAERARLVGCCGPALRVRIGQT